MAPWRSRTKSRGPVRPPIARFQPEFKWSVSGWVSTTARTDAGLNPRSSIRRRVSRGEKPESSRTIPLGPSTTTQFPELPEPRTQMRRDCSAWIFMERRDWRRGRGQSTSIAACPRRARPEPWQMPRFDALMNAMYSSTTGSPARASSSGIACCGAQSDR